MTYSQYPYVEAFINEKQRSWITAHVHMYEYFGGVTRILVPDNTTYCSDPQQRLVQSGTQHHLPRDG